MKVFFRTLFTVLLILILLFVFGLSMVFLRSAAEDYATNQRLMEEGAEVTATVTRITTHTDDDNDEYYKIYISYTYNNTLYSDIYFDRTSSQPTKGDTVRVLIDPLNPSTVALPDSENQFWVKGIIAPSFVCFSFLYFLTPQLGSVIQRKRNKKFYTQSTINTDLIREELAVARRDKRLLILGLASVLILLLLLFTALNRDNVYAVFLCHCNLAITLIIALLMLLAIRTSKKDVVLISDTLMEREDSDSEDYNKSRWEFRTFGKWKMDKFAFVTNCEAILGDYKSGSQFYIAYVQNRNKKKLVRLFDANEFYLNTESFQLNSTI